MNDELKSDANLLKHEPHPAFIEFAQGLAKQIGAYTAHEIVIADLDRMKGKSVSKVSNLKFTYFTEDEISLILNSSHSHNKVSKLLSDNFNREIKGIEEAWSKLTSELEEVNKEYAEAQGEIKALKFLVENMLERLTR